jgi:hypothetical protein
VCWVHVPPRSLCCVARSTYSHRLLQICNDRLCDYLRAGSALGEGRWVRPLGAQPTQGLKPRYAIPHRTLAVRHPWRATRASPKQHEDETSVPPWSIDSSSRGHTPGLALCALMIQLPHAVTHAPPVPTTQSPIHHGSSRHRHRPNCAGEPRV